MIASEQTGFVLGLMYGWGFDSEDAERILGAAGLTLELDSLAQGQAAIRAHVGEIGWTEGLERMRRAWPAVAS